MKMRLFASPPPVVIWGAATVPLGEVVVGMTEDGDVCRVSFLRGKTAAAVAHAWQFEWEHTYFHAGKVPKDWLKRDLIVVGTELQKRIWEEIARIPEGETATYGEIADRIDAPGRARAVGRACREGTLAGLVPYHRVVAAAGIGGYGVDGTVFKEELLKAEGVVVKPGKRRG